MQGKQITISRMLSTKLYDLKARIMNDLVVIKRHVFFYTEVHVQDMLIQQEITNAHQMCLEMLHK